VTKQTAYVKGRALDGVEMFAKIDMTGRRDGVEAEQTLAQGPATEAAEARENRKTEERAKATHKSSMNDAQTIAGLK
jgi:hypothetical protein